MIGDGIAKSFLRILKVNGRLYYWLWCTLGGYDCPYNPYFIDPLHNLIPGGSYDFINFVVIWKLGLNELTLHVIFNILLSGHAILACTRSRLDIRVLLCRSRCSSVLTTISSSFLHFHVSPFPVPLFITTPRSARTVRVRSIAHVSSFQSCLRSL